LHLDHVNQFVTTMMTTMMMIIALLFSVTIFIR